VANIIVAASGDNGAIGHDNINGRTSYYESSFDHNETWNNVTKQPEAKAKEQY
jgi:hypothetical protein